jgi:AbrB family looped-hinge helix DNA binding protein
MARKMKQSRKKAQKIYSMTVILKPKSEITVPRSVRRKAGIKEGDRIEFKVSGGIITILPELPNADDEYTPAERRAIDRGIAESRKDYREGRYYGPFNTPKELIASLQKESEKLRRKNK